VTVTGVLLIFRDSVKQTPDVIAPAWDAVGEQTRVDERPGVAATLETEIFSFSSIILQDCL
jgi:hypothetical protein